jgi:hypothetical protein
MKVIRILGRRISDIQDISTKDLVHIALVNAKDACEVAHFLVTIRDELKYPSMVSLVI